MESEKLKSYIARVTQANRSELIVIMFEVIIEGMDTAKVCFEEGNIEGCIKELKRSQSFLNELTGSLDYTYPIAHSLLQLYFYVNKRLAFAIAKRDPAELGASKSVMKKLLLGFEGVAKEDMSSPLMENTQKLYAGLTYGKGTLNEMFVNVNEHSRGYKA